MIDVEDLRDRIAKVMSWDRKGVDSFSLPQLREFVRGKDPKLDNDIELCIRTGSHLFTKPTKKKRRW